MIKAVFFDLYGTLAGFKPSRYEIQSEACNYFGIELTPEGTLSGYALADEYMAKQNSRIPIRLMDDGEKNVFFARYEKLVVSGSGIEIDESLSSAIWDRVLQIPYEMALFDDVITGLAALKKRGLVLGLISNMNKGSQQILSSFNLLGHLDFAVTSLEVGVEKPHERIFQAGLVKANVDPWQAMHVGDQILSDVEGAKNAGILPVLIDRDNTKDSFKKFPRIEKIDQMSEVIELY